GRACRDRVQGGRTCATRDGHDENRAGQERMAHDEPPINEIATTGRYDPISRRTASSHWMEPGLAGLIQVWQPGKRTVTWPHPRCIAYRSGNVARWRVGDPAGRSAAGSLSLPGDVMGRSRYLVARVPARVHR